MRKLLPFGWLANLLVGAWIIFTVSLTAWWYIFSQRQIEKLAQSELANAQELLQNQEMLFWEVGTLILCLILGGCALAYYVARDKRRSEQIMNFFLTFTHEMKTPLSTVRLYSESLTDKLDQESEEGKLAQALTTEIDRLSLQLDNSLALAQLEDHHLFLENLKLRDTVRPLTEEFSDLRIEVSDNANFVADSHAFSVICRNLFKNSLVHGKASKLDITVDSSSAEDVQIRFVDDGVGLSGERENLGKKFARLYNQSGSGIGLYLSSRLAQKMNGKLEFPESSESFSATLTLPRGAEAA